MIKKSLTVAALLACVLLQTGCDSGQIVQNAKMAITIADTARLTAKTWTEDQHAAGKLDEAKLAKWQDLDRKAEAVLNALRLTLAEYERTKGKSAMEKICLLIADLNGIINQVNELLKAFK